MSILEKKIKLVNGKYDIDFNSVGDFEQENGLETAILMSLFLDDRADESEVPQATKRGGYWGYEVNNMKFSKLWLVNGRRTTDKLNQAIEYANSCLQWLIDESYATDVQSEAVFITDGIELTVTISKDNTLVYSKAFNLWLNTDF